MSVLCLAAAVLVMFSCKALGVIALVLQLVRKAKCPLAVSCRFPIGFSEVK